MSIMIEDLLLDSICKKIVNGDRLVKFESDWFSINLMFNREFLMSCMKYHLIIKIMNIKYRYLITCNEIASNSSSSLTSDFVRSFDSAESLQTFEDLIMQLLLALQEVCPEIKFDKHIVYEDIELA